MNIQFRTFLRLSGLTCLLLFASKIAAQPSVQIVAPDTADCPGKLVQLEAITANCLNCSFLWSDGYPSAVRFVAPLASTSFAVTVTDPAGNTASDEHFITVLPGNFSVSLATDLGCSDGQHSLTATPSGGSGNYNFWWNNGGTSVSLENLSAGTYSVTVSDGNCQATASATVEMPMPLQPIGKPKFFGGSLNDQIVNVAPALDGGFVACGYTYSSDGNLAGNAGESDAWVLRLDEQGDLLWSKSYGGSEGDFAEKILPLPGGGFLVAANTNSNDCDLTARLGGEDWWVFRLDDAGQMLWQKRFGSGNHDEVRDMIALPDGNFLLLGYAGGSSFQVSDSHGGLDVWLLKINPLGEIIWEKTFGGSNADYGISLALAPDGGCVVLANSSSSDGDLTENKGKADCWLFRLDADGNMLWQKVIGGDENEFPENVLWSPEGDVYFSCRTYSETGDFEDSPAYYFTRSWVFRLSAQGQILSKWSGDYQTDIRLLPAPGGGIFGLDSRDEYYLDYSSSSEKVLAVLKFSPSLVLESEVIFHQIRLYFSVFGCVLPSGGLAATGGRWRQPSFGVPTGSQDAFFVRFKNAPPVSIFLGNDTTVCAGQPIWLDAEAQDCPSCDYAWSDGLPHPTRIVYPAATTNYSVTVTQPDGCTRTASRLVSVHAFDVALAVSDPVCGDPVNAISALPSGASGVVQFSWSNGSAGSQITSLAPGTYSVTASDGLCQVVKSAIVGGFANAGFPASGVKIAWQGRFGGAGDDQAFSARPTAEGGIVFIGQERADSPSGGGGGGSPSGAGGEPHAAVFKLDPQKNLAWKTALDPQDTLSSLAYDLVESPTGGFVFVAKKYWQGYSIHCFYQLDPQGEIGKSHLLNYGNVLGKSIENYLNGRYLQAQYVVAEFDTAGIYTRSAHFDYSNTYHVGSTDFSIFPDGKLVFTSAVLPDQFDDTYYNSQYGSTDAIVRFFNSDFSSTNSQTYGGANDEAFETILALPDGGFVAAGWSKSDDRVGGNRGGKDAWVLKANAGGTVEWSRTFGGTADDLATAIVSLSPGVGGGSPSGVGGGGSGYLLAGSTHSANGHVSQNKGGEDAWLLRLDEQGNLLWQQTFGGSDDDAFFDLRLLPDGTLLAAGRTASADADLPPALGGSDHWLVNFTWLPPTDFLGENKTICAGGNVSLAAVPGCDACTYVWSDGSTLPIRMVSPTATTTYAVTVTNPNGCTAADAVTVVVEPSLSAATLTLSPPLFACPNQEITLTAAAPNCPDCSFKWSAGVSPLGVGGGSGNATAIVPAGASANYAVTVSSPAGCSVVRSKNLIVHDLKVSVLQDGCSATAQATGGTFGFTFLWENGETDPTIALPGSHRVTVSDGVCDVVQEVFVSPAQAPAVEWELHADTLNPGTNIGELVSLPGGDVLVVGDSVAAFGQRTFFAARLKPDGAVVWKKTYPIEFYLLHVAVLTSDGNVVVNGQLSDGEYHLLKIRSTDGNLLWQRQSYRLNGGTTDINAPGQQNLYFAATIGENEGQYWWGSGFGKDDLLLMGLQANGLEGYGERYGGSQNDAGYDLAITDDNIFVVGSSHSSDGSLTGNKGGSDVWVMKTNGFGGIIWSKNFGGNWNDAGFAIEAMPDGGCIVAGSTKSKNGDVGAHDFPVAMWVFRLDAQGNMVWKKTFAASFQSLPELPQVRLIALSNGNFLASGAEMVELTPTGEVVWKMNSHLANPAVAANADGSIVHEIQTGGSPLENLYGLRKFKGFERTTDLLPDSLSHCHGDGFLLEPLPLDRAGLHLEWSTGDTLLHRWLPSLTADTIFILTATSPAGCSLTDTLQVLVLPHENFSLALPDTVCASTMLPVSVQPPCAECKYEWLWDFGEQQSQLPEIAVPILETIGFNVVVTDGNGCREQLLEWVQPSSLSASIEADLRCGEGASTLTATASGGAGEPAFLWNTGDSTEALAEVFNGNYTVTVSDGQCQATASFEVEIDNDLPRTNWKTKSFGHRYSRVRVLDNQQGYEVGSITGSNDKFRRGRFSNSGQLLDSDEFSLFGDYHLLERVPPGGSILSGGGYLLGGGAGSAQQRDVRLKKITPDGTTVGGSLFTAGTPAHDTLTCVLPTADQGTAFAGMSLGADGFYDVFVGKANLWGDVQWLTVFPNPGNDFAADLLEAPGGNFWLLGHARQGSDAACQTDLWLLKINKLGEAVQSKFYPAGQAAAAVSLSYDADGGLLALASKFSPYENYYAPRSSDAWALKINELGEVVWQSEFGKPSLNDRPAAIFPAPEGGYFLWMEWQTCPEPYVNCPTWTQGAVLKLDENGKETQRLVFPETPYDVRQAEDNGFIINGYRYHKLTSYPYSLLEDEDRLVKFDFRDAPTVELGNDTLLCPWQTLPLDAGAGDFLEYAWSNGDSSQAIIAHPGTYAVTVTDAKNCSRSDEITLTPCATFDLQTGNFCDTILLNANVPNAQFLWSTGATTPTISATQSGIYGVTVTFPATGFSMSDTAAVGIFQNNLMLQSQVENPACFGDSTGMISLEVQGSNGEPAFSWTTPGGFPASAEDLANLPAGTYFLTITDAGNCTLTEQFDLTQPAEIELFANVVDVFCFGDSTGSIQATAAGSQAFSSFFWSNGVASSFLENMPAGNYSVTVTDVGGCTQSEAWAISQPDSLALDFEVSPPDPVSGLLDLTATVVGGIVPFGFAWSNGSTASFLENVPRGWYSLTVTDGNGCTATAQILAGETATGEASGGFSLRLFPTPVRSVLTVEIGSEVSGAAVLAVFNGVGRLVFSEEVELRKGLQVRKLAVENWASGMYFLELRSEGRQVARKFLKVE